MLNKCVVLLLLLLLLLLHILVSTTLFHYLVSLLVLFYILVSLFGFVLYLQIQLLNVKQSSNGDALVGSWSAYGEVHSASGRSG